MYFHEVNQEFNEGRSIRRAGWAKKAKLIKANAVIAGVSIGEDQRKAIDLSQNAEVVCSEDFLILVQSPKSAVAGYKLTKQDELAQDWDFAD